MLALDRVNRITADKALQHPWFSNQIYSELQIDTQIITTLRQYRARSKMQKEAMNVMVKYLEIRELSELRKIFNKLDHTQSGTITAMELEKAMESVGE
jgi:calcium-dependent protein kinase